MTDRELFEALKNKLGTYSLYPMVKHILDILFENDVKDEPRPFWHGLTLLRWILLICRSSELIMLKKPDKRALLSMLNDVMRIEDQFNAQEMEKTDIDVYTRIHAIANQQFPFQKNIDKFTFPRQSILYLKINNPRSNLEVQIQKITSLSIKEIIVCSFFLQVCIYPEKYRLDGTYTGNIDDRFYQTIVKAYGEEKLKSFLGLLTLDLSLIEFDKAILLENLEVENPVFQIFINSFFTSRPIILINGVYRITHRKVLNVTSRYLIYDKLKSAYKEEFAIDFGERIEKYVEIGLKETNRIYKNEKSLKKILDDNSKVIDFLVEEKVLIECKGIELQPIPSVTPTKEVLARNLKGSIIKAIKEQITNVLNKLNIEKSEAFVIIVTYKELNLGFGKDLFSSIFKDEDIIEELHKLIDSNKVFVLDLEEWDILLSYLKHENMTLVEILQKVFDENKVNRKKLISMSLEEIFGLKPIELDYLNVEFDSLMKDVTDMLS